MNDRLNSPLPQARQRLDLNAYALARARGKTKQDAAKAAGCTASTPQAINHAATSLEKREEYPQALAEARAYLRHRMTDAWEKAQATMEDMLDEEQWQARAAAADFMRKVHQPEQVNHGVDLNSIAALVELAGKKQQQEALEAPESASAALPAQADQDDDEAQQGAAQSGTDTNAPKRRIVIRCSACDAPWTDDHQCQRVND